MKFTLAALLVGIVSAAPAELQKRADATCGNTHYSSGAVSDAAQASCQHVKAGDHAGSSTYPHQYKNYEGFKFQGLSGPFYEFPIKTSGVYTGGSPGADRVIITSSCQTAGVITHQGASGNNFVACSGGSSKGGNSGNSGNNSGKNGNTGSDKDEESLGFAVGASDMGAARVALGLGSVVLMYVL